MSPVSVPSTQSKDLEDVKLPHEELRSDASTSEPDSEPTTVVPRSVNWHYTRKCNYSCKFCFHTAKSSFFLPETEEGMMESKECLRRLKMAGMEKLNFSGGEPFLHDKALGELCRFCKVELELPSVSIVSNGSLIKESWMKRFGSFVDILAISCDSFVEETNVRVGRGRGEHLRKLEEIKKWCVEYKVDFKINSVINALNVDEDMSEHIERLQPKRWKVFQCLLIEGENAGEEAIRDARSLTISDEQFQSFLERHKAVSVLVPESNDAMMNSYLILDEKLCFLNCTSGGKKPSASIRDVEVEVALRQAGFDAEMFVKRGGVYDWTKQRDIEDLGEERWTGWTYTVDPVGGPGVKLQRCWLVAMKLAGPDDARQDMMDVKTQTAGTLVKKMYKGPRGVLGDRESRDECSWMLAGAVACMAGQKNADAFGVVRARQRFRRFTYSDFEKYFRKAVVAATPRPPSNQNRSSTRVFIIGPGFGNQINPRQSRMVEAAGYQMRFCFSIPNPEVPHFPVDPYLEQVKSEMDAFRPHVVMGASKGGVYIIGLWRRGYWRGPTVLINAHPTCRQLPQEANVVIAVGSNDEVYPIQRPELEEIMKTGGMNKTFLYFTADSGRLPSGQISRQGDTHNQESLLHHDVLPRLIDSVLCPEGPEPWTDTGSPEMHFIRTWKERLSVERNNAELWLGFSPEQQAYILSPPETWLPVRALRIQRVENGPQGDASWKPYYKSLVRSLEDQGVEFEPGTHTCWAFHGCNNEALESIINNPLSGFQPLASGSRSTTLWGSGTYFARDAKYVADGGFCGTPDMNGSRRRPDGQPRLS
eukprot:g21632.t1